MHKKISEVWHFVGTNLNDNVKCLYNVSMWKGEVGRGHGVMGSWGQWPSMLA